ncbi:MAG: hypothetical protein J6584_04375 [Lactobacillus sp.]|uniref:hypothetical protein n=1 Tax=Bombilactobacillus bombi TaxID=1303590 RepID=UPI0035E65B3F|nr:hypothetical protein [Lactobacillus sp.]MCO6543179.1 hypothetical protein [Lactobacillus sp.]
MMNNRIEVNDKRLTIVPIGLDKLWSFKSKLSIPLDHVVGATIDAGIWKDQKGIRNPGLGLPNKLAGTFISQGERTFWNAIIKDDPIVIQLHDEEFVRIVVSMPRSQARQVVDQINSSI